MYKLAIILFNLESDMYKLAIIYKCTNSTTSGNVSGLRNSNGWSQWNSRRSNSLLLILWGAAKAANRLAVFAMGAKDLVLAH